MAILSIEGMEFYAYHGYYEEERKIGGWYRVDVFLDVEVYVHGAGIELNDTINYEIVFELVKKRMLHTVQLIEELAMNILTDVKEAFSKAEKVKVKVSKFSPPLPGTVEKTCFEIEG